MLSVTVNIIPKQFVKKEVRRFTTTCVSQRRNLNVLLGCVSKHPLYVMNGGRLFISLCYVMLCYVMLCYVMLCYVMLCYVML